MMHGLTGVYLRVISTGNIQAGDTISHEASNKWRIAVIEDALQNPALSDEWRALIGKRLKRLQEED